MTSNNNLSFPLLVVTCTLPPLAHPLDLSALDMALGTVKHEVKCIVCDSSVHFI